MMEKELNPREERFLELLESTDYQNLTAEEQLLVQEFCTPEEYHLQRRMFLEAPFLFENNAEPAPLILDEAVGTPFWKRPIPLYQAITGIAATIALFFAIWPSQEIPAGKSQDQGLQTATIDTVYRTKTIHDTVVRYEKVAPTKKQSNPSSSSIKIPREQRIIESPGSVYIPAPSLSDISANGRSMKDDPATVLYLSTTYQYTDR